MNPLVNHHLLKYYNWYPIKISKPGVNKDTLRIIVISCWWFSSWPNEFRVGSLVRCWLWKKRDRSYVFGSWVSSMLCNDSAELFRFRQNIFWQVSPRVDMEHAFCLERDSPSQPIFILFYIHRIEWNALIHCCTHDKKATEPALDRLVHHYGCTSVKEESSLSCSRDWQELPVTSHSRHLVT